MKKAAALILIWIFAQCVCANAYAETDEYISKDPVIHTYTGRAEARDMIKNLDFTDLPEDFWAKDAIVRNGALNIVKGYDKRYQPDAIVSKEEAIAFVLRAIGLEEQAQTAGAAIRAQDSVRDPADASLTALWSLGYLNQASQLGLITLLEYDDAMILDQSALNPTVNFIRSAAATREEIAFWLVRALQSVRSDAFPPGRAQQAIYRFSDWRDIDPDRIPAVEAITENRVMDGDSQNCFWPKSSVTRAYMADILKNMDSLYYNAIGVVKKTGTVGGLLDEQLTVTGLASVTRSLLVRGADGAMDALRYSFIRSSSPQAPDMDAVVLREGKVSGLAALQEGDEIEYLVRPADNTVLYIQAVRTELQAQTVIGTLQSVDTDQGTAVIMDDRGKEYTYAMAAGLYGQENGDPFVRMFVKLSDVKWHPDDLPYGSRVELSLKNHVADRIAYLGEPAVTEETRGIVVENNTDAGFIILLKDDSSFVTKSYTPGVTAARKKPYYMDFFRLDSFRLDSFSGFYAHFDPADRDGRQKAISSIEPGDIVFYQTDPEDLDFITRISAAADYVVRVGKIKRFQTREKTSDMLIAYEDGREAVFTIPNKILVTSRGDPSSVNAIQPGDWVKMVVSQAAAGTIESVKEIRLEGSTHYISQIVSGRLAGLDLVQNRLILQNVRTLTKTGWSGGRQIVQFDLAGNDIAYYYEGARISPDYALHHLKRAAAYVALENHYTGEKVKKVVFRTGRDEPLATGAILRAENGKFNMLSHPGTIFMDDGVIVRRYGRLADKMDLLPADYAAVNITGDHTAAVVDIVPMPDTSGVIITRGRALGVEDGQSFQVESMALLNGLDWIYTPVPRLYAVDADTLLIGSDGVRPRSDFAEQFMVGRVYTIVTDGARAARVLDAPYAPKALSGVVDQKADGVLSIRDVMIFDSEKDAWGYRSNTDDMASVRVPQNAVLVKNNALAGFDAIRPGDQVRVMTDQIPPPAGGFEVQGYIVLVEK
jgi:hypothetical protein